MHSNGLNASGMERNGLFGLRHTLGTSTSNFYPIKGLTKKASHYTSYIYHLWYTIKAESE